MNKSFIRTVLALWFVAMVCPIGFSHAHDEEEKRARIMFNDAKLAIYDGKLEKGRELLGKVVSDFKGTMTASDAITMLTELRMAVEQSKELRLKAQKSILQSDIRNAKTLMEAYFADKMSYPESVSQFQTNGPGPAGKDSKLYVIVTRKSGESLNSGYRLIMYNDSIDFGLTTTSESPEIVQLDRTKRDGFLAGKKVIEKSPNIIFLK